MILTDRDRLLLGILGDFGILSTAQISSMIFNGVSTTTVLRRLRVLEARNLIRRTRGLDNGQCAWTLTSEGSALIGKRVPQKFINKNTLEHDVTLSQVRLALKTVGLGEHWQPEHVIRRLAWTDRRRQQKELSIVPDGIFVAKRKSGPKSIAVELELNLKSMSRYDEIFKRYRGIRALWIIWYIVPNKNIGEAILRRWEKSSKYSGASLGYSLLEEVLNNPWEMKWHFKSETPLIRDCIQMINPALVLPAQVAAQGLSTAVDGNHQIKIAQVAESQKFKSTPTPKTEESSVADPSPLNDRWEGVSDYGDPRGRGSEYKGGSNQRSSIRKKPENPLQKTVQGFEHQILRAERFKANHGRITFKKEGN